MKTGWVVACAQLDDKERLLAASSRRAQPSNEEVAFILVEDLNIPSGHLKRLISQ